MEKAPLPLIPPRSTKKYVVITKGGATIKALSSNDLIEVWDDRLRRMSGKETTLSFINGSVLFSEIAGITKE